MGVSREEFEEFVARCSANDPRGFLEQFVGVQRMDQIAAMTEEDLLGCIDLITEEDAAKVLFGIYLAYDSMEAWAGGLEQMDRIAEMVSGTFDIPREAASHSHFAAKILQGVAVTTLIKGALVQSLQRSVAERIELEKIVSGEDAEEVDLTLELAQEIRRVDGNHDLGAAALAEALVPFILQKIRDGRP